MTQAAGATVDTRPPHTRARARVHGQTLVRAAKRSGIAIEFPKIKGRAENRYRKRTTRPKRIRRIDCTAVNVFGIRHTS